MSGPMRCNELRRTYTESYDGCWRARATICGARYAAHGERGARHAASGERRAACGVRRAACSVPSIAPR
eukprot:1943797-Prymnesium_polylepis.2